MQIFSWLLCVQSNLYVSGKNTVHLQTGRYHHCFVFISIIICFILKYSILIVSLLDLWFYPYLVLQSFCFIYTT